MKPVSKREEHTRYTISGHWRDGKVLAVPLSLINKVYKSGPSILLAKDGIRIVAVGNADYGLPSFLNQTGSQLC